MVVAFVGNRLEVLQRRAFHSDLGWRLVTIAVIVAALAGEHLADRAFLIDGGFAFDFDADSLGLGGRVKRDVFADFDRRGRRNRAIADPFVGGIVEPRAFRDSVLDEGPEKGVG